MLTDSCLNCRRWTAIVLYPIGLWLAALALLLLAKREILEGSPSRLSTALAFLHQTYETQVFWWELAEMMRRFVLVGLFVVAQRGTVMQLFLGTTFCAVYLMVQLQARPYISRTDDFLGLSSSFCLLMLFSCCIFYKWAA